MKLEELSKEKIKQDEKTIDLKITYEHNENLLNDITKIISSSYSLANKSINYLLVQRNRLIGKRINEEILSTRKNDYGKEIIENLSNELVKNYGKGFTKRNLYYFVDFYNKFPNILHTVCAQSLLSWSHYRILLQISNEDERNRYANEAHNESWSVRTLQRNISSQYFRRLLSSNKKDEVHNEMIKINKINKESPASFIKDPMILEFLGVSEDNTYKESDLENAIISHIHKFLLELGKGYAFVARQQRIHTEKEDYFIDLVFYNYILKCFILIDLKTSKITHQDVRQMNMYIKMYDELNKDETDNPTLGIILTSETDEDIIKYSFINGSDQLFTSKYNLYVPSDDEIKQEIEMGKDLYFEKNLK